MAEQYGRLRIEARRGAKVKEIAEFLTALEEAYNNLYVIEFYISNREDLFRKRPYYPPPFEYPVPFERIRGLILPEDELRLDSVVIESPGWWEFLGVLNPIESLRKYLNDRHERNKDIDFRSEQEKEKGELEIERLKTQVLKEAGFSEEDIRRMIVEHGANPLQSLDKFQDSKLIGGASSEQSQDE
ncbi:hypothetical protein CRI93_14115 [Longimonas halophila]|uniref:Uncharacterized protein n=1 Tax=Longimonas halophila TaxID=1469170 RepID=A0A2H3NU78_9BACT|nr:hypothetical protein [Longimonas halophila]PEN05045.1 hypothetical protein CRI93_14115 [Longimonas halophila]